MNNLKSCLPYLKNSTLEFSVNKSVHFDNPLFSHATY